MNQICALGLLLLASPAIAKEPAGSQGSAALGGLVGTWTIQGRESTYIETCAWYDGERHIVCNTESKRADGSTAHSMSILGFVAGKGYVYTGIGSRGRYETYANGTFEDGILEYLDRTPEGITRIRLGPFSDRSVLPFNVHTSADGVKWVEVESFRYIRIK